MNEHANYSDLSFPDLLLRTYAQSRQAATSIRKDVLPALPPLSRNGAERLLRAIAARRLFNNEALVEIEVLAERISSMIDAETDEIECWDNDPHNMSGPAYWTEVRRSKAGDALSRSADALDELNRLIAAVLDHRVVETSDI
tara:strand:- start:583 stop:1008 length:426 start_codon:yes stop_codon:yes gene_type:complete